MLNIRFPPQFCLIVSVDLEGLAFIRVKIFIKLYLKTMIWNKWETD